MKVKVTLAIAIMLIGVTGIETAHSGRLRQPQFMAMSRILRGPWSPMPTSRC